MMIGISDYEKQKDQRSSFSSPNTICYYSEDGRVFPGNYSLGPGLKEG